MESVPVCEKENVILQLLSMVEIIVMELIGRMEYVKKSLARLLLMVVGVSGERGVVVPEHVAMGHKQGAGTATILNLLEADLRVKDEMLKLTLAYNHTVQLMAVSLNGQFGLHALPSVWEIGEIE